MVVLPALLVSSASCLLLTPQVDRAAATTSAGSEALLAPQTGEASPGFTLFALLSSRVTYLLDASGTVAHTWTSETPAAGATVLLETGHLLRAARVARESLPAAGGQSGRIQELDWDGKVVWDFELASEKYSLHHDLEPTPHGTVLAIAWEKKSAEEALAAGRDPAGVGEEFWPDVIVEIEPLPPDGGRIVWEWRFWDHVIQDRFPERANFGAVREHPELLDLNADVQAKQEEEPADLSDLRALGYVGHEARGVPSRGPPDWIHTNAIDYDAEQDLVLLCSRNLSEVWVIDHSTTTQEAAGHTGGRRGRGGDFLARWGNPQNHRAGTEQDQSLFHAHDAHWIPYGLPGSGDVLVFNNGPRSAMERASEVLEFRLSLGIGGASAFEAASSARGPVWSCRSIAGQEFFSSRLSGAQRLPNGNTLVTIGAEARLVEITSDGAVVWEYRHSPRPGEIVRLEDGPPAPSGEEGTPEGRRPRNVGIFRATRIAPEHPGLARLADRAEPTPR